MALSHYKILLTLSKSKQTENTKEQQQQKKINKTLKLFSPLAIYKKNKQLVG